MEFDPITNVAKDARILIVDDLPSNIQTLSHVLSRAGYAICISVTDSAEALQKITHLRPDIILLDWHMQPVSGLDFIEALKDRFPADDMPPVLVLSADRALETRREALAVGAQDFLSKPFNASELLLRIRNLLRIRHLLRQLQEAHEKLESQVLERTSELDESMFELRVIRDAIGKALVP
jgi:putative two-component system response regulator